jgi:dCTP deaminase
MKKKMNFGAIPDHGLLHLIHSGNIKGVKDKHVNPASLNLPLSEEVWRIERFILPEFGEKISDLVRGKYQGRPHSFSHPLEVGVSYLVRLKLGLSLEQKEYGFFNPRSTTGRTFLNVRVVADGVPRYDSLPPLFSGEVWLLVQNDIFSSLLLEDDELVQLRLFYSDTRLDEDQLKELYSREPLLLNVEGVPYAHSNLAISDNDGSLVMTLSIPKGSSVGWKTKFTNKPVKFSKENKMGDFFEQVYSHDGTLDLDSRTGLILPTKEILYVPSNMAAEGVRLDDRAGNFMSHRAGYFDPGFKGAITLEITGANETLRDGTSALKVKYEKLSSPATNPYKAGYSGQKAALLGKNFVH